MARKENKFHFIYKTTNLINSKFYVGMHSSNDLQDGYLGSGKRLRRSIRYHGKDNHKREILEFLPDREKLIEREKEIVNEDFIKDPLCINLITGGKGPEFSYHVNHTENAKNKISESLLKKNLKRSNRTKEKMSLAKKEWHRKNKGIFKGENHPMFGKKHSEESKKKSSESHTGNKHSEETKKKISDFRKSLKKIQ
jgi:group I intron endonuclease